MQYNFPALRGNSNLATFTVAKLEFKQIAGSS